MRAFLLLSMLVSVRCGPVDQRATPETKNLYNNLKKFARNPHKILFGHQESTLSGAEGGHSPYKTYQHDGSVQGWWFQTSQVDHHQNDELSDVKRVTGEYPAVIGFDFENFENDKIKKMTYLVKKAHEKGLVVTILQHNNNPITGDVPWVERAKGHAQHVLRRLLPGGDYHYKLTQNLDKIANWAHNLKDKNGKLIPVIYRPLHEQNGDWFWWGLNNEIHNSEQDLKDAFRFIVSYLRDTKGVRNFLYCISPNTFDNKNDYLKVYPGDDFVDILGVDFYYVNQWTTKTVFKRVTKDVVELAESKDKIPALTETGLFHNGINTQHHFWNDHLLDLFKAQPTSARIAYFLGWANKCWNGGTCELWVPYRGHPAANDFKNNFFHDPITVFGNELHNIYG